MTFIPIEENKPESPWMQITKKAYEGIKKVLGESEYKAHEGVKTALNQVYWIKILDETPQGLLITNPILPGQKKKVKVVQAIVEKDLVYPLIRGRDVKKWYIEGEYGYIIVPHDPKTGNPLPEHIMKTRYPKSYDYLYQFKSDLENRSIHKLWGKGKPFYSLYDIGAYTFSSYKIVWKAIAGAITGKAISFASAVLEPYKDKPVIPDASLMLIPVKDKDEAYYVCSILNSSIFLLAIATYTYEIGAYTHIVNYLKVLSFDPTNSLHKKLSELSRKAHEIAKEIYERNREDLKVDLKKIEEEIDNIVAKLYGITDEELKEIKKCLKALMEGELEEEEVEEIEELQVNFNANVKPLTPGYIEVLILNPQNQKVRVEIYLPEKKEVIETNEKEKTFRISVKPLKPGEYRIPYKVIVDGRKEKEDELVLYVKQEKKVRKKDKLDDLLDELL